MLEPFKGMYYVHKFLLGVITLIRLRIVIAAASMTFSMVSAFKGLSLASSSSSLFFKGDSGSFNVASILSAHTII
ncbi:hypothetical protein K1719_003504 [Acacia pycnantha]|nr:hypothetical protein K1719_003504 [Acacia pycnantha]